MTDERKRGDEEPVGARDDEGGAAEPDETAPDEAARAKRWADERTEHWHGARSSDATQGRTDEE